MVVDLTCLMLTNSGCLQEICFLVLEPISFTLALQFGTNMGSSSTTSEFDVSFHGLSLHKLFHLLLLVLVHLILVYSSIEKSSSLILKIGMLQRFLLKFETLMSIQETILIWI